jgi:acetyl esterase
VPLEAGIADKLQYLEGIGSFEELFTDPARKEQAERFTAPSIPYTPPAVNVENRTAPGPHGEVPVRVYRPVLENPAAADLDDATRPALVWMHGGAFVGGDLNMPEADWVSREVCKRADAVVVSVDYRLARPGRHFPIPHDDVVAAWRWSVAEAANLGIDPRRVSIGGASAGANLAAGAALHLRDDADVVLPAALLLAYPCVHAVLPPADPELTERMQAIPRMLRFLPADVRQITELYVGGPQESAPDYAMPAQAELAGLPPTLVITAEYDDLLPSGEAFAALLTGAGVEVTLVQEPGMLHGHLNREPAVPQVDHSLNLLVHAITGGRNDLVAATNNTSEASS